MVFIERKRGIVASYLPWLLIALAVLAVVMILIFLLRSEGSSLIEKMKNLFEFGLVFCLFDLRKFKGFNKNKFLFLGGLWQD